MKRFFLICLSTLALTIFATAAQAASYVKITGQTGQSITFALSERPKATLTATSLMVTTANDTIYYPLSEYRKFELADEATAISNPQDNNGSNIVAQLNSGTLQMEGLKPGSAVAAYTVGGARAASAKASANGSATLSLSGQKGIIIVETNGRTFKFISK